MIWWTARIPAISEVTVRIDAATNRSRIYAARFAPQAIPSVGENESIWIGDNQKIPIVIRRQIAYVGQIGR